MTDFDKKIAYEIATVNKLSVKKLGLRFDKVVIRLLGDLSDFAERIVPKGETILLTITAPIKVPAKTEQEIERRIRHLLESGAPHRDWQATIFENKVRLRIFSALPVQHMPMIGFVHNPDTDPKLLLDLAVQWLGTLNAS